jgi:hypothetical protein
MKCDESLSSGVGAVIKLQSLADGQTVRDTHTDDMAPN